MTKAPEIFIRQVRSSRVCDCDPSSTCGFSAQVSTVVRTWDELVRVLEEAPHMDVVRLEVRRSQGPRT